MNIMLPWMLHQNYFDILYPLQGLDSLAGVEANISHLVVKEFQIPCAHAPAVSPIPLSASLSPRSAAEEVYTIFPC